MQREDLNDFLQAAPQEDVLSLYEKICDEVDVHIIQQPTPQTLLVPVRDPINGGKFYGGEVLVTSSIVRVGETDGWSMVLDDSPEQSLHIAVLDGAYAGGIRTGEITALAEIGEASRLEQDVHLNRKIERTRVSFDLM